MIVPRLQTMVFLGAAVPVAAIGLAVLVAGWVLVTCLAITPLVVPALVAFRAAAGGIAWLDGQLANELLDTSVQPPVTSPGPGGFWRSGLNVLGDGAFWRQQAYLMIRLSLGFALGIAAWAVLAAGLGLLTLPAWYRFDNVVVLGRFVDTIGRALLGVPAGLAVLAVLYLALGPLRRGSHAIVVSLLTGPPVGGESPEAARRQRRRALALHALSYAVLNLFLVAIWALSSSSTFWPVWTLIALGLPLGAHAVTEYVISRSWPAPRSLVLHAGLIVVLSVFLTLIWVASGFGYFWPAWAMLGLGITLAIHAAAVLPRRSKERIAELEETRAGAVEQQGSELARIERDLHDGAQARLVALGMQTRARRAEARDRPGGCPGASRGGAARNARGARGATRPRSGNPPAGARRPRARSGDLRARRPDAAPVDVKVDLPHRPSHAVETAAYFVVAESLANAASTPEPEPSRSLSVSGTAPSWSRSPTTASGAPTLAGGGLRGSHAASRRSTADSRSSARPAARPSSGR